MAAQKGREFFIQALISGSYVNIGGLRTKSLDINEGTVDVSDSDSDGWVELLADAALMSIGISGNGVFKDSAGENFILTQKLARVFPTLRIIVPGLGRFDGVFMIGNLQQQGGHDNEIAYSMQFMSSGEITFTAS